MPLQHSLSKVNKKVTKSKGAIHPKGRSLKQLNRAGLRQEKLAHRKALHLEQKQNDMLIYRYIQEEINQVPDKEVFGLSEMKAYIENFLGRFDEELKLLQQRHRPGRPIDNRQKILQEKIKYDQEIYRTGIKIPDIGDKATVEYLRQWNGSTGGINALKCIHVSKDMTELPEDPDQEMN